MRVDEIVQPIDKPEAEQDSKANRYSDYNLLILTSDAICQALLFSSSLTILTAKHRSSIITAIFRPSSILFK